MGRQYSTLVRKVYAIFHAMLINIIELYNILFMEIIKLDLFYIEYVYVFLLKTFFLQHVSNISQERESACDRNLINYSYYMLYLLDFIIIV